NRRAHRRSLRIGRTRKTSGTETRRYILQSLHSELRLCKVFRGLVKIIPWIFARETSDRVKENRPLSEG
uniref:hypothetical protein n=1 Tax=Candidatus Avalokitesvara rifleensis TaxID=3367620 RepID=UPI004024FE25